MSGNREKQKGPKCTQSLEQDIVEGDEFHGSLYETSLRPVDYLMEEYSFKGLSDHLSEIMEKKEIGPQGSYAVFLHRRLQEQLELCRQDPHYPKDGTKDPLAANITDKTVRRWFNGDTLSIRHREDLIRICYALDLELEDSSALINKCGQTDFSSRNPEDLIHIYCLTHRQPYSAAYGMIHAYRDRFPENAEDSGDILPTNELRSIAKESCRTPEDFFTHELLPAAPSLLGFSRTAVRYYRLIKNELFVHYCRDQLSMLQGRANSQEDLVLPLRVLRIVKQEAKQSGSVAAHILEGLPPQECDWLETDLPYATQALRENSVYCARAYSVIQSLQRMVEENQTRPQIQQEISQLCDLIIRRGCFLDSLIASFEYHSAEGWHLPQNKKSILPDAILAHFPQRPNFRAFESTPDRSPDFINRRLLLLLYFMLYSYECSFVFGETDQTDETPTASRHSRSFSDSLAVQSGFLSQNFAPYPNYDLGAAHFIEHANKLLCACSFAPLYLSNQFDALLTMCVRSYELYSLSVDVPRSPLALFTYILALSYNCLELNEENFTDPGFLLCVKDLKNQNELQNPDELQDPDERQTILRDESPVPILTPLAIAKIHTLDCSYQTLDRLDPFSAPAPIAELTGVEHFSQLRSLNCSGNQLTHLELDGFAELTRLNCSGNRRTLKEGTPLSDLPGFDPSRASELCGGSFEGGLVHFTASEFSYTYNCGRGFSARFTLVRA